DEEQPRRGWQCDGVRLECGGRCRHDRNEGDRKSESTAKAGPSVSLMEAKRWISVPERSTACRVARQAVAGTCLGGVADQTRVTFAACSPLSPVRISNSTSWPSASVLNPSI